MLTDRRPILLANARLIDPSRDFDGPGDVLIADGMIREARRGIGAAGVPEGNSGTSTITFTLEVWNFTLNSTASLKSTNGIHFWGLPHGHPNLMVNGQPDGARLAKLRARYGQLALDHRYSLGFNVDDGTPQDDLNHFDTFYGPAFKGTLGPGPSYDPASIGSDKSLNHDAACAFKSTASAWSGRRLSGRLEMGEPGRERRVEERLHPLRVSLDWFPSERLGRR